MSKETNGSTSGSVSVWTLLVILFIALKLTGHITWSWVWVLAPFWGIIAVLLIAMLIVFIITKNK